MIFFANKKLAVIFFLLLTTLGRVAHAEYIFDIEPLMEGGYDYTQFSYHEVYDPDQYKEILVGEKIEVSGSKIHHHDLVLDDNDKVHAVVIVRRVGLQYVTNVTGEWTYESLQATTEEWPGRYIGIKRDDKGHLHVLFNAGTFGIWYYNNVSGEWESHLLDSSASGVGIADFQIDDSNHLHLAYLDDHGDITYGKIQNPAYQKKWIKSTSASTLPKTEVIKQGFLEKLQYELTPLVAAEKGDDHTFMDVKLHTWNDLPVVSYQKATDYVDAGIHVIAKKDESTWDTPQYFSDTTTHYLHAVNKDADEQIHIWSGYYNLGTFNLVHFSSDSPTKFTQEWQREEILSWNGYDYTNADILFHPLGKQTVVATWCWNNGFGCEIMTLTKGVMKRQQIDTEGDYDSGSSISLALSSSGDPHILYVNKEDPTYLKYAKGISENKVDNQDIVHTSIALTSEGLPVVMYYKSDEDSKKSNGDLKVATQGIDGSWLVDWVDTIGNTGYNPDVFVDSTDRLYASYYYLEDEAGYSTNQLKFAENCFGKWSTEIVDGNGTSGHDVGRYSSIVVDAGGAIHIAYYDADDQSLRFATKPSCSAGSWSIETVDGLAGDDVGQYVDMGMDTNGVLHLIYFDATHQRLKYAHGTSGDWVVKTIDVETGDTEYLSMAIDSTNKVHVAYHNQTEKSLRYISNRSSDLSMKAPSFTKTPGWKQETVDREGHTGWHVSLAMGADDRPVISYYNVGNSSLMVATKNEGDWHVEELSGNYMIEGMYSASVMSKDNYLHIVHVVKDSSANMDLHYVMF